MLFVVGALVHVNKETCGKYIASNLNVSVISKWIPFRQQNKILYCVQNVAFQINRFNSLTIRLVKIIFAKIASQKFRIAKIHNTSSVINAIKLSENTIFKIL